jgi:Alkylmercury lyase
VAPSRTGAGGSALTTTTDRRVRLAIYERLLASGVMPGARERATEVGLPVVAVEGAFERVTSIVPEPGDPSRIRMAKPFSAVPTPFEVESGDRRWWGNCIWDALGIAAIVNADATVHCSCVDCDQLMTVEIRAGEVSGDGIVHFGTPANQWWDDIVYT